MQQKQDVCYCMNKRVCRNHASFHVFYIPIGESQTNMDSQEKIKYNRYAIKRLAITIKDEENNLPVKMNGKRDGKQEMMKIKKNAFSKYAQFG